MLFLISSEPGILNDNNMIRLFRIQTFLCKASVRTIEKLMKWFLKIVLVSLCFLVLISFWYWVDNEDYFNASYRDLTEHQKEIFKWRSDIDNFDLPHVYREHFADSEFIFPRQQVARVKLFKNIPIVGVFTGKTLKQNQVKSFLQFCNDTANFGWGETTWELNDAEYYIRLYNSSGQVAGKIYFCLAGCGRIDARPFSPSMKFGMLSATGLEKINKLINDKNQWE
jgi:hypothetical protein